MTPDGLNTILHELRHIALQNPAMKALLDEKQKLKKEEPFVQVLDYLRATEIGDERNAENPVCQAPRGGCPTFFSPGPDRP
jgi:uncharacterized Fe-S cluster-containing protein